MKVGLTPFNALLTVRTKFRLTAVQWVTYSDLPPFNTLLTLHKKVRLTSIQCFSYPHNTGLTYFCSTCDLPHTKVELTPI